MIFYDPIGALDDALELARSGSPDRLQTVLQGEKTLFERRSKREYTPQHGKFVDS